MIRWFGFLVSGFFIVVCCSGCSEESTSTPQPQKPKVTAKAPVKNVPTPQLAEVKEPEEKKFVYSQEGRRDPFVPLTTIRKPISDSSEPMTPLQKYDLTQYRLMGVLIGKGEPRAMVMAPDGKSYILTNGLKIGKNEGVVIAISSQSVQVEEKYYDFSGNVLTNILEIKVPTREGV